MAPRFDNTPFRTPDVIVERALSFVPAATYAHGLDVCCGTGDFMAPLQKALGSQGNVFGMPVSAANPAGVPGGRVWRRTNTRYGVTEALTNQTDLFGTFAELELIPPDLAVHKSELDGLIHRLNLLRSEDTTAWVCEEGFCDEATRATVAARVTAGWG